MTQEEIEEKGEGKLGEMLKNVNVKKNLYIALITWSLGSFNFYMLTFFAKYFPGNLFINQIVFAISDLTAFITAGIISSRLRVYKSYIIGNTLGFIGGLLFIFYADKLTPEEQESNFNRFAIPVIIFFSRVGCQMN